MPPLADFNTFCMRVQAAMAMPVDPKYIEKYGKPIAVSAEVANAFLAGLERRAPTAALSSSPAAASSAAMKIEAANNSASSVTVKATTERSAPVGTTGAALKPGQKG